MYVDLLPKKNSAQKFPAMSEASEDKTNCDWIDLKSRGSLVYPSKDLLEKVEK